MSFGYLCKSHAASRFALPFVYFSNQKIFIMRLEFKDGRERNEDEDFFTVNELAEYFGVDPKTIYEGYGRRGCRRIRSASNGALQRRMLFG